MRVGNQDLLFTFMFRTRKINSLNWQKSNPKEYFNSNIFFAGKRVTELQYWDEKFSEQDFNRIMNRYEEQMIKAFDSLDFLDTLTGDNYHYFAQSKVTLVAYSERLEDIISGGWGEENSRWKRIKNIEEALSQKLQNIFLRHYRETSYFFDVPETANYRIFS